MRVFLWCALALLASHMAKAAGGGAAADSSDEELRSRSGNSGSKERARKKRAVKAARKEGAASASDAAPPWLSAALDAQTKQVTASIRADLGGTLAMITDNLNVITTNQQEADRKIDLLAQQQANFEATQAKFQMELQILKSSRTAASSGGGSNGSTAAPEGGGGNPYSKFEAPRELDKARFIIGGWKNSLSAVVEKQVKDVISLMAEKPKLELLDLGGSRMDYCFVKFLPQPGFSALQLGSAFKSFLYDKKIPATGNATKVLWAQPNRTLEARTWRKSINSVRRFLHTVREGAGMSLNYVEHEITTEVISGDYRATKRHVAWKGEVVCTFPSEGEVCWKPAAELASAFAGIEGFTSEAFLKGWHAFSSENNLNNMEP